MHQSPKTSQERYFYIHPMCPVSQRLQRMAIISGVCHFFKSQSLSSLTSSYCWFVLYIHSSVSPTLSTYRTWSVCFTNVMPLNVVTCNKSGRQHFRNFFSFFFFRLTARISRFIFSFATFLY